MNTPRLVECVPNFSEGRDPAVIRAIAAEVEGVDGVRLLDVDPGRATNRTVVTFVGEPEPVCEAAFRATKKAAELIDMRTHRGEHPRFGATDVLPLVPVSGITMEETVAYARKLGKRIGDELGISVYCYESAATSPERRNLAAVREGEYEGLRDKLARPEWKPDFGPAKLNEKSGAIAVGARDFLIAYNVNLNTTSLRRANAVAFDVREKGRVVTDAAGVKTNVPGTLKCVKAIGWFIEEYGICQISMNLTNIAVTPLHVAFDEVCRKAEARGLRVTGSEIVGLVPQKAMLDAGRYFLRKQRRSTGVADSELLKIAIKSMGLSDLKPFDPEQRILERVIAEKGRRGLVDLTLRGFVESTASESPAPGGGSVAAAVGALGAALGAMVANLSAHKAGPMEERWEEFSGWAEKGKACHDELLALVDADTDAFNRLMAAFGLPKGTPDEKAARTAAIQAATEGAIATPMKVMETALASFDVLEAMASSGNPNSISDAGVGALCARTAVLGAWLNVKINAASLADKASAARHLDRGRSLRDAAMRREQAVLEQVDRVLEKG